LRSLLERAVLSHSNWIPSTVALIFIVFDRGGAFRCGLTSDWTEREFGFARSRREAGRHAGRFPGLFIRVKGKIFRVSRAGAVGIFRSPAPKRDRPTRLSRPLRRGTGNVGDKWLLLAFSSCHRPIAGRLGAARRQATCRLQAGWVQLAGRLPADCRQAGCGCR
jgi:hypothetical protein